MLTFKNKSLFLFENLSVKKISFLLKTLSRKKNDNKKKSQVIQYLNGIGEVNHVHDNLSHPNSFYGDYLRVSIEERLK